VADEPGRLPSWVTWQQRPFPDANLLLLPGRNPALVDSGFVGHARQTADWVHVCTGQPALVVNTLWHADHVGGNAMLQVRGPGSRPASRTPTRSPVVILAAAFKSSRYSVPGRRSQRPDVYRPLAQAQRSHARWSHAMSADRWSTQQAARCGPNGVAVR
jgi:glyoxylase-like metal-dependent hydrolase (beta-lactamase superfamily II)